MRLIERLLTAALAGVVFVVAEALPANAASRSAGAYVDGSGNPTAEAADVGISRGRDVGAGPASDCTWQVINADDSAVPMYDVDGAKLQSETGRWLEQICDGQPVRVGGAYAIPERNRPPTDAAALARKARQSVAIPTPPISTSPQADRQLYTRVRTWLWVDDGWWRDYSATADAGGVSTTVSARPVRAVWSMGDGGTTTCDGPGRPWRSGLADDATDCSYLYENSSATEPGGTYTMTVTVTFAVSWSSSIGSGGTLAPVTRSVSRPVRVGEIQAIETD